MDQLTVALASTLIWLKWLVVCVVATEAVSEIVVESKFFEPFHRWVRGVAYPEDAGPPDTRERRFFAWFDSLTSCGYCLSVWVAGCFAPLMTGYPDWSGPSGTLVVALAHRLAVWLAYLFTIHRLSNWLHVATELHKRGRVRAHDHVIRLSMEAGEEATK